MQFSAFSSFGFFEFSGEPSLHEQFYDMLPALWGTQHDMSNEGTYEEAKLFATSGMCALMLTELKHAGNQFNPLTAYDLLPLLENDYLLSPGPKDGVVDRQNAVAAAMLLPGGAKVSNVVNALKKSVGAAFIAYLPNPAQNTLTPWSANTAYSAFETAIPLTGPTRTFFVTVTGGTSGPTEPLWPLVTGEAVLDGTVLWSCLGAQAAQTVFPADPGNGPGKFSSTQDSAKFLRLVDPVATIGTGWVAYTALDPTTLPSITWSPGASFSVGQSVLPTLKNANGLFFSCSLAGSTGTTEPLWAGVVGDTIVDGSVTWTCVATVAPSLAPGDVVVVDPGNTSRMETVTVLAVANILPVAFNCSPGQANLFFQADFTRSHDVDTPMTTGHVPYWWSTQRLNYVVLGQGLAVDAVTRAKVDRLLGKALRATDIWAIVQPSSTTPTGGTVGPLSAGMPMGCVPIGTIPFVNSN